VERGERQQRLLLGGHRARGHLPNDELNGDGRAWVAVEQELARQGGHAVGVGRRSHELADAEGLIGEPYLGTDSGRDSRRHAEHIDASGCACVAVSRAVESQRIRTHNRLLKRNLHSNVAAILNEFYTIETFMNSLCFIDMFCRERGVEL